MPKRIRVRRVGADSPAKIEVEVNKVLGALESLGQEVQSVQFEPGPNTRPAIAYIVYDDQAGVRMDEERVQNQELIEMVERSVERDRRAEETQRSLSDQEQ